MKFIYQLKRGHLIIAALLILNITAFFSVSAISAKAEEGDTTEQNTLAESETYIKSGVKVLNWSYSLLRYFRHQDAE